MRIEHLKFPLHAEQTIRLPKGCRINGVTVKDDITFLVIENPNDNLSFSGISARVQNHTEMFFNAKDGQEVQMQDHKLRVAMEGEMRTERDADGKEVKTIIPVPEESDTLRKVASFETVTIAAKWHLFLEV